MSRTVENLSVALIGAFAGGCLFVSAVLVPAWRRMDPEEVLEWFASNELRSGLTLATLEAAGTLGALGCFLGARREGSDGRLPWALASLCMVATFVQLPLYFVETNKAMVRREIPPRQVGTKLDSWSRWQWARTLLAVAAVAFSLWGASGGAYSVSTSAEDSRSVRG